MKISMIILGVFLSASAVAASDAIVEQFKDSKDKISKAEAEKRKVLGTLYTINQRMKKVAHEKGRLTDEMDRTDQSARAIAQVIKQLEVKIAAQRAHLRARLRVMYKLSGESYLAILFSQTSAHDFDQSLKFLQIIARKDQNLIRNYRETVAEYEQQKDQLKKQVAHLLKFEKGVKDQEALLTAEQTTKSQMVARLEQGSQEQRDKIKGLRQQKRKQASEATGAAMAEDAALNLNFFEQKGQLPPPALGEIARDFGLVYDVASKVQTSHKGWRYKTVDGAPVNAVFEGTVVYADSLDGYGPTLILDHGDHYYTVYAGLTHLRAEIGEHISQGQEIAQAGLPRPRYAAGLYFEIRHFSEPENPHQWISPGDHTVALQGEQQ